MNEMMRRHDMTKKKLQRQRQWQRQRQRQIHFEKPPKSNPRDL